MAILAVLREAAREIYRRLMDAVDPALVDQAEQTLRATPGVLESGQVRLRWIGHQLRAECEVIVDSGASAIQAHQVAVSAEHDLLHALPRLSAALVHADPQAREGTDPHAVLAPHRMRLARPSLPDPDGRVRSRTASTARQTAACPRVWRRPWCVAAYAAAVTVAVLAAGLHRGHRLTRPRQRRPWRPARLIRGRQRPC